MFYVLLSFILLHRFYQFYLESDQKAHKTASLAHRVRKVNTLPKARSRAFGVGTLFLLRCAKTVLPGTERLF